jgi:hypothetical protein
MKPTPLQLIATLSLVLAIAHTFAAKRIHHFSRRFPDGSIGENTFVLLGEVEVVFGFWAALYLLARGFIEGFGAVGAFTDGLHFSEPLFVFVIMTMAATRPVLSAADALIAFLSRLAPRNLQPVSYYFAALTAGPLLGSLITEPAAMTVTALMLKSRYYDRKMSRRFMYSTLGALFVNVSIGGTLTSYAAPPVLMVAGRWGWDTSFMLTHFGWKALLAVIINAGLCVMLNRSEIVSAFSHGAPAAAKSLKTPLWVMAAHGLFLCAVVLAAHHVTLFFGIFLFFLGFVTACSEYNDALKLKESMLVAFFLAGLVVLGSDQGWWLMPLLTSLKTKALFVGATTLTAITDNAALTYLGAQVPSLSAPSRYALVAGAVAGGGLTVIANAPNPAGYSILNSAFGKEGMSAWHLFLGALVPTLVAVTCLLLAPGWS